MDVGASIIPKAPYEVERDEKSGGEGMKVMLDRNDGMKKSYKF